MNIGLISINMYTKGLNFACPLHTYAFQQFLLKNGIKSTVINYKPVYYGNFDLRHPYDFYKKLCERRLAENNLEGLDELIEKRDGYEALYQERETRHDKFQAFIDNNYIKTDKVYNSDLLEVEDPGFDCYICVTDVIWKKDPGGGFDRGFFLGSSTMRNKWKIAYAASRGVYHSDSEDDERRFLHYIDDLDFIGVREASLQDYINKSSNKDAALVLDPVMLHDRSFYDELAIKPREEDYLFLYYVMEQARDTLEQAVAYARAHNLKIVEVTDRPLPQGRLSEYDDLDVTYRYDIGIEEWLGYFKHAKVVFTNSFHATCFSILFEKDFYVGQRSGDKVTNALATFGLTNRRFTRKTNLEETASEPIDYTAVRAVLEEKRAASAKFILNAIHTAETTARQTSDYEWWEREQRYKITYQSGRHKGLAPAALSDLSNAIERHSDGSLSYYCETDCVNDGLSRLSDVKFFRQGYRLRGWHLRFKIDNLFFWYLENGRFVPAQEWDERTHGPRKVFSSRDRLPYIPVERISTMAAVALWEKEDDEPPIEIVFNSGARSCTLGNIPSDAPWVNLPSESIEYRVSNYWRNNGKISLPSDSFNREGYKLVGWRARVKIHGRWYWLLSDGSLKPKSDWSPKKDLPLMKIAADSPIPFIAVHPIELIAVEAIWRQTASRSSHSPKRIKQILRRKFARQK